MTDWETLTSNTRLELIRVGEQVLTVGARVRLCPKRRADAFDLMLEGRTAVIEGIEQDMEDRVYVAVVVEDDPGRDLGADRKPAHRFFYAPDEVELLPAKGAPLE